MSAAGRGAIRREDDAYYTPAWAVRRILEALNLPGGRWLEPSAGGGAIIRAVNAERSDVLWTAVEINESCGPGLAAIAEFALIGDFLAIAPSMARKFEVAILNPPFIYAREFVDSCRRIAGVVVVLERLNWLGGEERNAWLRESTPDVYVLPNRPSFTGGGTDATEYAWFVWGNHRPGWPGRLFVLPNTSAAERNADPRQIDLFDRAPRAAIAPPIDPQMPLGTDQPTMACQRCGREYDDFDGAGVIYCDPQQGGCGFCRHMSREKVGDAWVCNFCKDASP